ncbi:MAG: hypothetical protein JJU00_10270, partial [Opitutales bacterium]|nr:hypothetical protein [Opitutales bacterium]
LGRAVQSARFEKGCDRVAAEGCDDYSHGFSRINGRAWLLTGHAAGAARETAGAPGMSAAPVAAWERGRVRMD